MCAEELRGVVTELHAVTSERYTSSLLLSFDVKLELAGGRCGAFEGGSVPLLWPR